MALEREESEAANGIENLGWLRVGVSFNAILYFRVGSTERDILALFFRGHPQQK